MIRENFLLLDYEDMTEEERDKFLEYSFIDAHIMCELYKEDIESEGKNDEL